MTNIGLNIIEVDGRAAPAILAAPTSITAFIIRAPRGVVGAVRRITNWTQFTEAFGSYVPGLYGAYAVRGFFDNGGTVAYVTRVAVGATAAQAAVELDNAGGDTALTLRGGYRGQPDPGTWARGLGVQVRNNAADATRYDVLISSGGRVVETFEDLSHTATDPRHVARVLNDEFTGSRYVVVAATGADRPASTVNGGGQPVSMALEGGADDDSAGDVAQAIINALPRYDAIDVQLLVSPELSSADVVRAASAYCENRNDCMFIGHTTEAADAAAAKTFGEGLRGNKVYGALYFPWLLIKDPLGGNRYVPPSGHVAGVYARVDRERGVFKAPAGVGASVLNVLDVRTLLSDVDHTDLVKNGGVNAIRAVAGQGIIVDSARTLSSNTLWLYVSTRLLFNFIKSSLKNSMRWVVHEPNDRSLWNRVKYNTVTPFLMGLWQRGAFGSGTPEQSFTVKIDDENNPPAAVQQGIFTAEIYIYAVRPAETVVITIGQQDSGGSAGES